MFTIQSNTRVDFTRTGWKKFCKANRILGVNYIRAFILKREVGEYIAAHENAGQHLDTICQELRYDERTVIVLCQMQGTWYITDVILTENAEGFMPIYVWQRIKRGIDYVLAKVLCAWRPVLKGAGRA